MTTAITRLAPRLAAALEAVSVAPSGLSAEVGGRTITGEDPRDLRGRLSGALYELLHAGTAPERERKLLKALPRDLDFERVLGAAVPHREAPVNGILMGHDGDELLVRTALITVRVGRDRLAAQAKPAIGDVVELRLDAARPALSPGFFYVLGSHSRPQRGGAVRRIFVHLTDPDGAVAVWRSALVELEERKADYHAKILATRPDFPRRDALVIYLHEGSEGLDTGLAERLRGMPALGSETSVLTQELTGGVAAAWEPADPRPGQAGLSFGQHRCFALARALVEHALDPGTATLADRVSAEFRAANIDPSRPDRNLAGA